MVVSPRPAAKKKEGRTLREKKHEIASHYAVRSPNVALQRGICTVCRADRCAKVFHAIKNPRGHMASLDHHGPADGRDGKWVEGAGLAAGALPRKRAGA